MKNVTVKFDKVSRTKRRLKAYVRASLRLYRRKWRHVEKQLGDILAPC